MRCLLIATQQEITIFALFTFDFSNTKLPFLTTKVRLIFFLHVFFFSYHTKVKKKREKSNFIAISFNNNLKLMEYGTN